MFEPLIKITPHIIVFVALAFSCKKSEKNPVDFDAYTFDQRGKSFSMKQQYTMNGTLRSVDLVVPEGAVNEKSTLEYYTLNCDTGDITDLYINWWAGDINLFCSTAKQLSKPATIKLPMPWSTYSASNLYKPYKIRLSKNENAFAAVSDPSRRELITNFTWDNSEKQIIIQTTDLNAAYIIAKPK